MKLRSIWPMVWICWVSILFTGCSTLSTNRGLYRLSETEMKARMSLLQQYDRWQGTPYRLGGETRSGVDCSAFVQQTFSDRFGVMLPRSTDQQMREGFEVSRSSMQVGDLVFFRIGYTGRHVGVYLGGNEFMHASVSNGVTISSLDAAYWRKYFWQVRRVVQLAAS